MSIHVQASNDVCGEGFTIAGKSVTPDGKVLSLSCETDAIYA